MNKTPSVYWHKPIIIVSPLGIMAHNISAHFLTAYFRRGSFFFLILQTKYRLFPPEKKMGGCYCIKYVTIKVMHPLISAAGIYSTIYFLFCSEPNYASWNEWFCLGPQRYSLCCLVWLHLFSWYLFSTCTRVSDAKPTDKTVNRWMKHKLVHIFVFHFLPLSFAEANLTSSCSLVVHKLDFRDSWMYFSYKLLKIQQIRARQWREMKMRRAHPIKVTFYYFNVS